MTATPRRMFAYLYANIFKPVWSAATTIMKPFYNYFVAVVTTILPASMNPFHSYIVDHQPQDIFTRFSHGGQHLIWSWKTYVYTTRPNTLRKSFHEQLAMDPLYYDVLDEMDRNGVLPELRAEEAFKKHAREQLMEHFKEVAAMVPEQIPRDGDEMYRQAIGAQTTFGWWMQKIFFWWSDLLYNLEWLLDFPISIAVRFMRRFGFQRETAMIQEFERRTNESFDAHRNELRYKNMDDFMTAWKVANREFVDPMMDERHLVGPIETYGRQSEA